MDNRKSYQDRFIDLRPVLDADKTRQELNELWLQDPDKFILIVRPRWDCIACGAWKPCNEKPDGHWVARTAPREEGGGIYFVHICDPSCESTGSVNITYPNGEVL